MKKTYYEEGLYLDGEIENFAREEGEQMRALLMKNHGVGIMGGYYEEGLPVCMCSELLVEMLGYASGEEFHALAGGLVNIICPRGNKVFTEEEFKNWAGPMERYMRTREGGALGVRIVKEDQKRSDGVVM